MKVLFSSGIAMMHRLSREQKLPIIGTVLTVPALILFIETRNHLAGDEWGEF